MRPCTVNSEHHALPMPLERPQNIVPQAENITQHNLIEDLVRFVFLCLIHFEQLRVQIPHERLLPGINLRAGQLAGIGNGKFLQP